MGSTVFRNPQALSSTLAIARAPQPRAFGFLNTVDPMVSVSNLYLEHSVTISLHLIGPLQVSIRDRDLAVGSLYIENLQLLQFLHENMINFIPHVQFLHENMSGCTSHYNFYMKTCLCSKMVRYLDQWDLRYLETLRPLVVPSLSLGHHSPGPSGF